MGVVKKGLTPRFLALVAGQVVLMATEGTQEKSIWRSGAGG